ncbi:MBL fold metallo-hydrolase [Rhodoferax koreense]|uniref:MBL fold metallo-hydrolase n=1 Tax=Rhodoferax koreensis TaxID=1842727 RepID=A0A1P8JSW1_9BURK|nr:MBL fold metallo-hydrolase [Rhodoferax koreense]APW36836.1 MBL fold metallo-hydrolase [Rhodoferax koreense]
MSARMHIEAFFDGPTGTVSYVVSDAVARRAAIIDPVLDYDAKSGCTGTASIDRLLAYIAAQSLVVDWILETHAHADHLSAAPYLKAKVGGRLAIGRHILGVQATFKKLFNLESSFVPDGRQFDHLFEEGEHFRIGGLDAQAIAVPGHTSADVAYGVGDAVFVGDTLFMPDVGTARADFPGGDAAMLYRSIHRLLALPEATRLFVCHDYPPAGRAPAWQTTVAAQRAGNIHVHEGVSEAAFVAMRNARDAGLELPTLIIPAIQVNVRAGQLPPAEDDGVRYLKIPINVLGGAAAKPPG